MRQLPGPPAEVRPAADLAALGAAARAAHAEVRAAGERGVLAACRAGEALAAAAQLLKGEHGWLAWLAKLGLPRRTATNYLIIHRERAKWATVAHIGVAGVLNWLCTGRTGEEDEEARPPREAAAAAAGDDAADDELRLFRPILARLGGVVDRVDTPALEALLGELRGLVAAVEERLRNAAG